MNQVLRFRSQNLSNPFIWLGWFITLFMLVLVFVLAIQQQQFYLLFFVPVIAAILIMLFVKWFSIIEVNETGVTYQSIFKKRILLWEEIKTAGMYISRRYTAKLVDKQKRDEFYFGMKQFYVSTNQNQEPHKALWLIPQNIVFSYRKNVADLILKTLKEKNIEASWNGGSGVADCC
jgi:hypothetical protein